MSFELSVLDAIQASLRCGFLDRTMPVLTSLGNGGAIWIGCTALLLAIPKTRRTGLALALGLAVEVLCCNVILKPLVGRIRPCDVKKTVQLLVARPTDFSFPSGHTGASFAAASALYFSRSKLWIPALVLAALIAFSRLYLYVHYPSDVIAGMLIGIMAGYAGVFAARLLPGKIHRS